MEGIGFISAGELKASDEVRLQSGEAELVDYIEEVLLDKPIKVYNFEVDDFHTYYVSEQKVLVHNTCPEEKTLTSDYLGEKSLYRVMSAEELDAVKKTGKLRGGISGDTYFTDSYFKNADKAKARLALKDKPAYIMEFRIKGNINLRGGTRVKPLHGEPGGGREYVTNEIVEIEIVNYQKMVGGR